MRVICNDERIGSFGLANFALAPQKAIQVPLLFFMVPLGMKKVLQSRIKISSRRARKFMFRCQKLCQSMTRKEEERRHRSSSSTEQNNNRLIGAIASTIATFVARQ
jgi:hypothetical protein